MEFNKKLQQLRKQKNLTQEDLASALYVSRTAISKWESGRGYPNIDSLRQIAKFFGITVDELLSGEELLDIASEDSKQGKKQLLDLVYALLDLSALLFLFLPFFVQRIDGAIEEVSLLNLTALPIYLKASYFAVVIGIATFGLLTLVLQNCNNTFWIQYKNKISLLLNASSVVLFIISSAVYAAVFSFAFLFIKVLMLLKKQ
ncbi:MAG: helix-turn-helix transcriptional regulator [Clostridia bacterium]|nr:helix-turn-helix transcriptional regulator [Clostridia bacterium]